ncbi:MAG: ribonuclease HII, partial [Acidimicrobiales bacterium]
LEEWAADWSIGWASAAEIDRWGLRFALAVAATRALDQLVVTPTHVLIDGPCNLLDARPVLTFVADEVPRLDYAELAHTTIIKGDRLSCVIAAASVLAKVRRDVLMNELDGEFPNYGWSQNKGYGVPRHLRSLRVDGPCHHHRQTWRLVQN